ncbi:MAG: hypothetical protein GY927_14250 [bacterium]|nr:hypothetical protein [bacterium]
MVKIVLDVPEEFMGLVDTWRETLDSMKATLIVLVVARQWTTRRLSGRRLTSAGKASVRPTA